MVLARIMDLFRGSEGHGRVYHALFLRDEMIPFLILRHRDGTVAQVTNHVESILSFALENAGVGVVRLLNFANNNGLKFTTGTLKVQVGLAVNMVSILIVGWA